MVLLVAVLGGGRWVVGGGCGIGGVCLMRGCQEGKSGLGGPQPGLLGPPGLAGPLRLRSASEVRS